MSEALQQQDDTFDNQPKEIDIYSDILTDQEKCNNKLQTKIEKLQKEKSLLLKSYETQQKVFKELQQEYKELLVKYEKISFNSSSLFKTAQREIKRKDSTIQQLRRELDNLVFRKIPANHSLERARKVAVNKEKKARSPLKKCLPAGPGPPMDDVGSVNIINTQVGVERDINVMKTNSFKDVSCTDSTKSNHTLKVLGKTLPPIQGTITEYSRRMFKRIHGKSPVKTPCINPQPTQVEANVNNEANEEFQSPKPKSPSTEQTAINKKFNFCSNVSSIISKLQGHFEEGKTLKSISHESNINQLSPENKIVKTSPEIERLCSSKSPDKLSSPYPKLVKIDVDINSDCSKRKIHPTKISVMPKNKTCIDLKVDPRLKHSIASKLQKQVEEVIKLGSTPNKSVANKLTTINKNNTNDVSPTFESPSQISPDKTQQLVIRCEVKGESSKSECEKPLNSISVNETIDNILRKYKAGVYSSKLKSENSTIQTELIGAECDKLSEFNLPKVKGLDTTENGQTLIEKQSKMAQSDCSKFEKKKSICEPRNAKPNRLLANLNKKVSNKTLISPVTFGKLVSQEKSVVLRSQCSPELEKRKSQSPKTDEKSCKRKLSSIFSPAKNSGIDSVVKSSIYQSYKKRKLMTCLFGDSPSKSNDINEPQANNALEGNSVINCTPESALINPSSPVFPDSPSLDTDDSDDLVIDTTACSHNASPKLTQNSEKDESENVDANITTKSPEKQDSGSYLTARNCKSFTEETLLKASNKTVNCENTLSRQICNEDSLIAKDVINPNENEIKAKGSLLDNNSKDKKFALPDLSECFSLDNLNHLQVNPLTLVDNNHQLQGKNSSPTKIKSDSVSPVDSFNKETIPEIDLSHSTSEETKNESTPLNSELPVQRFIPSPNQLTLVSVSRHSENSLFTISEDTLGFVAALTRVRDISPIRTPGKINSIKSPESCSPESFVKPKSKAGDFVGILSTEITKQYGSSGFEFLETTEASSTSMFTNIQSDTLIKTVSTPNNTSVESDTKTCEINESGLLTVDSKSLTLKTDLKTTSLSNNYKLDLHEKHDGQHNELSNKQKKAVLNSSNNVFKRKKPLRLLVAPSAFKAESTTNFDKENVDIKSIDVSGSSFKIGNLDLKDGVKNKMNEAQVNEQNCENQIINGTDLQNTIKVVQPESPPVLIFKKADFESNTKNVLVTEKQSNEYNILENVNNCQKSTFKRSESLKNTPKPYQNYNILNKTLVVDKEVTNSVSRNKDHQIVEIKQNLIEINRTNQKCISSCDHGTISSNPCSKPSCIGDSTTDPKVQQISDKNKQANELNGLSKNESVLACEKKSTLIKYKNLNSSRKPSVFVESIQNKNISIQETTNKELEQVPHIANINQKIRVSNYHRDKNSEILLNKPKNVQEEKNKSIAKEKKNILNKFKKCETPVLSHQTKKDYNNLENQQLNKQRSFESKLDSSKVLSSKLQIKPAKINVCSSDLQPQSSRPNTNTKSEVDKLVIEVRKECVKNLSNTNNKPKNSLRKSQSRSPEPLIKKTSNDFNELKNKSPVYSTVSKDNHLKKARSKSLCIKETCFSDQESKRQHILTDKKHKRNSENQLKGHDDESPELRARYNSNHRPKNKSPKQMLRSKSDHRRRHESSSPEPSYRSIKYGRSSRRSQSKSPSRCYMRFPDHRSRARRRSPHRQRNSSRHYRRSRSRSPYSYKTIEDRRNKSRLRCKRSRSSSPYYSRKRRSRSKSPDDQKHYKKLPKHIKESINSSSGDAVLKSIHDNNINNEQYKVQKLLNHSKSDEENEKLRKQVEFLKNELNKKHVHVPLSDQVSDPFRKDDQGFNLNGPGNSVINNTSVSDELKIQEVTSVSTPSPAIVSNNNKIESKTIPVIRLPKRNVRNLGDSDVKVVSTSSKLKNTPGNG